MPLPMPIVNIAAYRFVSLEQLPELRERLLERCTALALKGTVLLAPEGINLFLAGSREAIDALLAWLHHDPRLAGLTVKESLSAQPPFGRLRVRLKREIITMRLPTIRPEGGRAPAVDAATLQRWLDQGHDDDGREVVMVDTRNTYETALGAFDSAVDYRLASFAGFPAAIATDRARYAGKTVVSYCTGGIRCEKAALHMHELGIPHVYQLNGGILKYLEQTDGTGWHGDCFVFDERGAVDRQLAATSLPTPREDSAAEQARLPLPREETTAWMQEVEQCRERLPGVVTKGNPRGTVREQSGDAAKPERAIPALPAGERIEVRGRPCDEPSSKRALIDAPANTRPLSAPAGHLHSGHPWPSPSGRLTPCKSAVLPICLPKGEGEITP